MIQAKEKPEGESSCAKIANNNSIVGGSCITKTLVVGQTLAVEGPVAIYVLTKLKQLMLLTGVVHQTSSVQSHKCTLKIFTM